MTDDTRKPYEPPTVRLVFKGNDLAKLRDLLDQSRELTPIVNYQQLVADLRAENADLRATIARVAALGRGSGYIIGDDALIRLGDVRAALRPAR